MFGDMHELALRSTELRSLATRSRADAARLVAKVDTLWVSTAASAYSARLAAHATDFRSAAAQLDEAAAAIDAHIAAVEEARKQIADAERWVTERWDDAQHLVRNVVQTVEGAAAGVFEFFGQKVPAVLVDQAKEITQTVRSLPTSGSPEWLDLASTFKNRGWE